MIDLEDTLSWEHVSRVVKNSDRKNKKWINYFPKDERKFLQEIIPTLSNNDEITQQYIAVLRRIKWCIKYDRKPESDEGFEIASQLIAITNENFQGNTELMEKFWEIRKLPAEETGLYPIS